MKALRSGLVACWLSLCATAAAQQPQPAANDVARSRELFDRGKTLADAGDFTAACPLFQEANDLNRTNGTALQLAHCYEKTGQAPRALSLYRSIVDAGDERYPERVTLARERIAAIEREMAAAQPAASTATPPAPPPSAAPPPPRPAAPTQKDEPSPSRAPAFIAFGAGAAGLAVGAVFGVLALSQAGSVDDACPGGVCPNEAERQRQAEKQDAARTKGWISTAGFGVGLIGVAAGAVLLATGSGSSRAAASARGLRVRF